MTILTAVLHHQSDVSLPRRTKAAGAPSSFTSRFIAASFPAGRFSLRADGWFQLLAQAVDVSLRAAVRTISSSSLQNSG